MRVCPSCKTMNEDESRFCEKCGTLLEEPSAIVLTDEVAESEEAYICPACGTKNEQCAKFCERCGARMDGDGSDAKKEFLPTNTSLIKEQVSSKVKKISKWQKIVTVEMIGVLLAGAAFFYIGNEKYSAENVARVYIEAYDTHDWNKVYSLLDLPEGNFLKESQFEKLMEKEDLPKLSNDTLQQVSGSPSSDVREFEIQYSDTEDGATTMDLSLVRKEEKKWLFFDDWYVSSEAVLSEAVEISVPAGSKVTVDDVELTKDNLTASNEDGSDLYTVSVFDGTHEISVAAPWCEVYAEEFNPLDTEYVEITDMVPTKSGLLAMQAKMQEYLEVLFSSAFSGADFSAVEGIFTAEVASEYEETYNNLIESLKAEPDDKTKLKSMTFSAFDTEYEDGYFELLFDYDVASTYTWYDGHVTDESSDGETSIGAYLVYEDGTYKIAELDMPSMYW